MATTKVRNGDTITTQIDVALGDRLLIAAGGAISRSGAVPAVRVTGAEAVIRNEGTISVTGASGAALTGSLSGVLALEIVNGGTIQGSSGAVAFSSATGTTGDVRLVNSGTIDGGASQAVTLKDLRAATIMIANLDGGLITNAGTADVLRPGHDLATAIRVVNAGDIVAGTVVGATSGGDGIDFQAQDGGVLGTVINRATGHIEGGKHGITGANAAFIVNEAGGEIIGRNGSGLNYDTEAADGDGAVRVVNHGLISGRYDGFGEGDGDGVDVDYLVAITNDGTIEGAGADDVDNFADGVAAGGGTIHNLAGGAIYGAANGILIDDGNRAGAFAETRIVNAGTILAGTGYAIRLIGDFDDTIVNSGTILSTGIAAIDAGAGDDRVVNRGVIAGPINLGVGNDVYAGADGVGLLDGVFVDGGAGDDVIAAGLGADTIVGGFGVDRMTGGEGDDRFVFGEGDTGANAATADKLPDAGAGDTIDLTEIDADTTTNGDQAFIYVGDTPFTGVAGELRVRTVAAGTFLLGDTDGDSVADIAIMLGYPSAPTDLAFDL